MAKKKDPRLARAGVSGYNKPKRTPNHPTKSHVVVAKEGDKIKTIRFGQQGKKVGTVNVKVLKLVMLRILKRVRCQQLGGLIRLNGKNV